MIPNHVKKIPSENLYVSEPDPSWFGNGPNERSKNKNWTNENWLKSRFHFSFAEYTNEGNTNFGVLRVLNDDLVQPSRGFGEHPHKDVEICTYVVDGFLTHKDSMGTQETLGRGAVQFMTAGKGVYHSESNESPKDPLRFLQLWITTRQRGLKPNYGSYSGDFESRRNKWSHMVSDVLSSHETPIKINQDANVYVTELDPIPPNSDLKSDGVPFTLSAKRQAYLVCVEGDVVVTSASFDSFGIGQDTSSKSIMLKRGDGAELVGPSLITVTPTGNKPSYEESTETVAQHSSAAHLLMVEMQQQGYGRSDL